MNPRDRTDTHMNLVCVFRKMMANQYSDTHFQPTQHNWHHALLFQFRLLNLKFNILFKLDKWIIGMLDKKENNLTHISLSLPLSFGYLTTRKIYRCYLTFSNCIFYCYPICPCTVVYFSLAVRHTATRSFRSQKGRNKKNPEPANFWLQVFYLFDRKPVPPNAILQLAGVFILFVLILFLFCFVCCAFCLR